jgi:hypothetical protein
MKIIPLANGRGDALVDDADYDLLALFPWYLMLSFGRPYAASKEMHDGRRKHVYMHRMIVRPPPGMVIDHIDGNSLNNQRANLRICTRAQNLWNAAGRKVRAKSGVRGVYWHASGRWYASLTKEGARYCLGYSKSLEGAIALRRAGELAHFGEYAATEKIPKAGSPVVAADPS